MARPAPPAYAWDWFARQRLLWREVRSRLAASGSPAADRYGPAETRSDVVLLLRADYPHDPEVRRTVDGVVAEVAFLGRTDRPFARLGARNAPRGMRWWWTTLTGEVLDGPPPRQRGAAGAGAHQLVLRGLDPEDPDQRLDDVHEGYGG